MSRVLITDAQERSVLAACRSLGRRGYAVDAAASERPAATHWSRFCANRLWTSDPKAQPAEFVEELRRIFREAAAAPSERPRAIICHTVKGKGIPVAENNPSWHHKSDLSEKDLLAIRGALGS
jgi:transketolase